MRMKKKFNSAILKKQRKLLKLFHVSMNSMNFAMKYNNILIILPIKCVFNEKYTLLIVFILHLEYTVGFTNKRVIVTVTYSVHQFLRETIW